MIIVIIWLLIITRYKIHLHHDYRVPVCFWKGEGIPDMCCDCTRPLALTTSDRGMSGLQLGSVQASVRMTCPFLNSILGSFSYTFMHILHQNKSQEMLLKLKILVAYICPGHSKISGVCVPSSCVRTYMKCFCSAIITARLTPQHNPTLHSVP